MTTSTRSELSDDFDNRAAHDDTRERAEAVVWDALTISDAWAERKRQSWDDVERLMNLESLADAAREMDVHLGEAFRAREDAAVKFHRMVFGSATNPLLAAELEEEGDAKRAKVAAALVEEAWRNDMKFEQKGLEWTREVFGYGALYFKILPDFQTKRTFSRTVSPITNPFSGRITGYKRGKKKDAIVERFGIKSTAINPRYFRYPPGASDMDEAMWVGDWSTITEDEFDKMVEDKMYAGPGVEKAKEELTRQRRGRDRKPGGPSASSARGFQNAQDYASVTHASLKKPQASGNAGQISIFEWHGLFDLEGDGDVRMCMIVAAFPMDLLGTIHNRRGNGKMWILSVGASPFAHQRKPYILWPCMKLAGDMDGMSVVDVAKRHSNYADEFHSLALMGAYLEHSPPIIVEDPDIPDEALVGFFPGKRIRGRIDGIGFMATPNKSNGAMRLAEYLQAKDKENVGLGTVSAAPRVAAAGIQEQTQAEDLRLLGYVNPFEQYALVPGSQLVHSYFRQYLTTERAVQVIGLEGIYARTRATVTPEDMALEIRFEPAVGRRLSQKVFQSQNLLNTLDRALVINQQAIAMGQPPPNNINEMLRSIYADGFGIQDVGRFIYDDVDPETIRTAEEEHELYAYGQRPGVQRGENKLAHARQHLRYWLEGATELQRDEDRLAFFDHLLETIEAVARQIEMSMPGAGDMLKAQLQQMLGGQQGTRHGYGQPAQQPQGGGRGISGGVSQQGSPMIRPDRPTGLQGQVMSQSPNLGAA